MYVAYDMRPTKGKPLLWQSRVLYQILKLKITPTELPYRGIGGCFIIIKPCNKLNHINRVKQIGSSRRANAYFVFTTSVSLCEQVCSMGVHVTFPNNAATEIGRYVSMNIGNVNV